MSRLRQSSRAPLPSSSGLRGYISVRRPEAAGLSGLAAVAAAGLGAAGAMARPSLAVAAVGGLGCLLLFVARPWTILPVLIVGGELVGLALHVSGVTTMVALHGGFIAVAFLALALRRIRDRALVSRVHTRADGPALAWVLFVAVFALWGLAAGHEPHQVVVATYEMLVAPLYYLLATLTLRTRAALGQALRWYLIGALVMVAVTFTGPAHTGGLLSGYALVILAGLAAADQLGPRRRWLVAVVMPLFVSDVALSGFRSLWLSTSAGLLLLFLHHVRRRPALIRTAALLVVLGAAAITVAGVVAPQRAAFASAHAKASMGYRLSESSVALGMVANHPIIGNGLGAVAHDRYIDGLGYHNVGPILHSFWLTVAINGGIIQVALVLMFLMAAMRAGRGESRSREAAVALGARFLVLGTALSAQFAGPTNGHWELGLMVGLALVADHLARETASAPAPEPAVDIGRPLPTLPARRIRLRTTAPILTGASRS